MIQAFPARKEPGWFWSLSWDSPVTGSGHGAGPARAPPVEGSRGRRPGPAQGGRGVTGTGVRPLNETNWMGRIICTGSSGDKRMPGTRAERTGGRRSRLVIMTAGHADGGQARTPAEQPRAAAAAGEPELKPLQRLIRQRLRERGWSYGEASKRGGMPGPPSTPSPRRGTWPGRRARDDRRARQRPRRAGLRRPRRRGRVHRTALLRRGPRRAGAPRRPGAGTPDRQHRRADGRGPASRGRAGRIAAEQDFEEPGDR